MEALSSGVLLMAGVVPGSLLTPTTTGSPEMATTASLHQFEALFGPRLPPGCLAQAPGCGFPILRLVALMNLATGMIVQWALGPWRSHELGLFQTLWDVFKPGDVLVGDRGFSTWELLAQCLQRRLDAVFRVRGKLRGDFRRGRRLSKNERLVTWSKSLPRPRTIRRLMIEAARQYHVYLELVSFAGSLAAARRYAEAPPRSLQKAARPSARRTLAGHRL